MRVIPGPTAITLSKSVTSEQHTDSEGIFRYNFNRKQGFFRITPVFPQGVRAAQRQIGLLDLPHSLPSTHPDSVPSSSVHIKTYTPVAGKHRPPSNPRLERFCVAWQYHAIRYEAGHCAHVFRVLDDLYEGHSRHYHDKRHITHCMEKLDEASDYQLTGSAPGRVYHKEMGIPYGEKAYKNLDAQTIRITEHQHALVELALWFHDAVYTPGNSDNENRSAHLFEELSVGHLRADAIKQIYSLIVATEHKSVPQSHLEQLMVDIDLSSFSVSRKKFLQDGYRIRQEFGEFSDREFVKTQTEFLIMLLNRKSIYLTPYFRARYEVRARLNIINLLELYNSGFSPTLD